LKREKAGEGKTINIAIFLRQAGMLAGCSGHDAYHYVFFIKAPKNFSGMVTKNAAPSRRRFPLS
jgi:hypothetical protein